MLDDQSGETGAHFEHKKMWDKNVGQWLML